MWKGLQAPAYVAAEEGAEGLAQLTHWQRLWMQTDSGSAGGLLRAGPVTLNQSLNLWEPQPPCCAGRMKLMKVGLPGT